MFKKLFFAAERPLLEQPFELRYEKKFFSGEPLSVG
jgi:hypothetical protein